MQKRKKGALRVNIERLLCSLDRREEISGERRIKVAGGESKADIKIDNGYFNMRNMEIKQSDLLY